MRTRRLLVALALPLALTGLTACGDDGDSATEPSGASAGESAGDDASADTGETRLQRPRRALRDRVRARAGAQRDR